MAQICIFNHFLNFFPTEVYSPIWLFVYFPIVILINSILPNLDFTQWQNLLIPKNTNILLWCFAHHFY